MLRRCSTLISALLVAVLSSEARAVVTVFQDPSNTGTTGAPAVNIPVGGAPVALNLFYQTGTTASTPATRCLSGTGDEVCGWDIHVSTSSPSVVLGTFTPDAGPGSDIVAAISGNVLRANGGVPTVGELGIHRIGTLTVSATGAGNVIVSGNLYVTAALAAATVTTGNTLAIATGGCSPGQDPDSDGVCNPTDNCPTIANTTQTDGDGDLVGDLCDNCTTIPNPRVASNFLSTNPWATLTGGQRDDDHDGYGNRCDAKFPGVSGVVVGSGDLAQFRASNGKNRTGDTCGTIGTRPCAIYDLDETGLILGTGDLGVFRSLNGKTPGPRCAACTGAGSVPLPCTAGASGSCS